MQRPGLPGHPHPKAPVYPGTHTYRGVLYDTPHQAQKSPSLPGHPHQSPGHGQAPANWRAA
ncbi:hypothetical protein L873DRAFT_1816392 [Choiromyces venosus 120613-1]|uniref:Uncharacterized protein n=1 Tax=Choiromyces venosus 120613-1 TaxID=1336337 RepID=A0A3N4J9M5_9PEZI|nr:hypothetical protein L873DRAFT_1816392 [Choiromyces venosus 120613-1]